MLTSLHFIIPLGKLESLVEQIEVSGENWLGLRSRIFESFHSRLDFLSFLDLSQRPGLDWLVGWTQLLAAISPSYL